MVYSNTPFQRLRLIFFFQLYGHAVSVTAYLVCVAINWKTTERCDHHRSQLTWCYKHIILLIAIRSIRSVVRMPDVDEENKWHLIKCYAIELHPSRHLLEIKMTKSRALRFQSNEKPIGRNVWLVWLVLATFFHLLTHGMRARIDKITFEYFRIRKLIRPWVIAIDYVFTNNTFRSLLDAMTMLALQWKRWDVYDVYPYLPGYFMRSLSETRF